MTMAVTTVMSSGASNLFVFHDFFKTTEISTTKLRTFFEFLKFEIHICKWGCAVVDAWIW